MGKNFCYKNFQNEHAEYAKTKNSLARATPQVRLSCVCQTTTKNWLLQFFMFCLTSSDSRENVSLPLQHLLPQLQTQSHKLLHIKCVVSELGVWSPVLGVLALR